jgi:hypothetical protein
MKYPQHEKLAAVAEQSQAIGEFLDWLQDTRVPPVVLCRVIPGQSFDPWAPVGRSTEQLLAEYFGVDLTALEAEKRAMLAEIRKAGP